MYARKYLKEALLYGVSNRSFASLCLDLRAPAPAPAKSHRVLMLMHRHHAARVVSSNLLQHPAILTALQSADELLRSPSDRTTSQGPCDYFIFLAALFVIGSTFRP